jgi:EAL domain-containing protein (putative c-di-GMP-specific phosphodiesterase class I)
MKATNARDNLFQVQATTDYLLQRLEDNRIVGHFANNRLASVFQPIVAASALQVIGHAAYIQCDPDGKKFVSPWEIFSLATEDSMLVKLDRLCRTVHALNYFHTGSGPDNLFVNVQPRLLESVKDDHGHAFAKVLDLIGIATSRVVIEIPAEVNRNWKLLGHVIGNYRSHGYRIAANHSGTGENWMAELGSLYPDIVRLEASALMGRFGARTLVDSIHQFGASVLVYEIETSQHKAAAFQEGADLLQGRALGVPARAVEPSVPVPARNHYPVPSGNYRQRSFRGSPD